MNGWFANLRSLFSFVLSGVSGQEDYEESGSGSGSGSGDDYGSGGSGSGMDQQNFCIKN